MDALKFNGIMQRRITELSQTSRDRFLATIIGAVAAGITVDSSYLTARLVAIEKSAAEQGRR